MQSRSASVCFAHFSTKSPSASLALSTQSSHATNAVLQLPPFMNLQKPHSSSSSCFSPSAASAAFAPSPAFAVASSGSVSAFPGAFAVVSPAIVEAPRAREWGTALRRGRRMNLNARDRRTAEIFHRT